MMNDLTPYLGRPYEQGIVDCFTVVQDFYKDKYQILVRNYARPANWAGVPGLDFFTDKFEAEGFEDTGNSAHRVRYGDVLMMHIAGSEVVNHVAIYVGRQKILHHLEGRLSEVVDYSPRWRNRVVKVVRHNQIETMLTAEVFRNLHKGLPAHLKAKLRGKTI